MTACMSPWCASSLTLVAEESDHHGSGLPAPICMSSWIVSVGPKAEGTPVGAPSASSIHGQLVASLATTNSG